jgi:ATP-dependent exoDNAse (exonuclease V) alpha subunit
VEAKTIHRLLEFQPAAGGFARSAGHPLECDVLVTDETSMIDVPLMHKLIQALPERAHHDNYEVALFGRTPDQREPLDIDDR